MVRVATTTTVGVRTFVGVLTIAASIVTDVVRSLPALSTLGAIVTAAEIVCEALRIVDVIVVTLASRDLFGCTFLVPRTVDTVASSLTGVLTDVPIAVTTVVYVRVTA